MPLSFEEAMMVVNESATISGLQNLSNSKCYFPNNCTRKREYFYFSTFNFFYPAKSSVRLETNLLVRKRCTLPK